MALCGCTNGGLLVTALVTLLLVPAQYYILDFSFDTEELALQVPDRPLSYWLLSEIPLLDLILAVSLFIVALMTHLCDWIQRKLMERRLTKLKQDIRGCADRLREWDARQEKLDTMLSMVQSATTEYNLLLYLRLHRAPHRPEPCFFDKDLRDFSLQPDNAPDACLM